MSDLHAYLALTDDLGKFKFSAGYDLNTKRYFMPSMEFMEVNDPEYPSSKVFWDNPKFLYEDFYPYLEACLKTEPEDEIKERFEPVASSLEEDDFETLIELLDQGRNLGWDKL